MILDFRDYMTSQPVAASDHQRATARLSMMQVGDDALHFVAEVMKYTPPSWATMAPDELARREKL